MTLRTTAVMVSNVYKHTINSAPAYEQVLFIRIVGRMELAADAETVPKI